MNSSEQQERIGTPWIVTILAILALLILGLVLYLRMGVRIDRRTRSESARLIVALGAPATPVIPSTRN